MSKSCIKRILGVMLSMLLVFGLTAFAAPALETVETLDATVAELEASKLMATEGTKEVAAAELDIAGFDTIFVSGTTEAQTLDAEATYTVALTDGLGFITLGSTTDASAFAVYKVTEEEVSKLETAPIVSEDVASIRGGERIGLRFKASVSNDLLAKTVEADGYAAAQYGFLVTLEKHVASVNALTMSLVDTGKAVKGVAFDKETGLNNIYETTESGVVFTGVLLGLPDTAEAYQTKLYVRPFVTLSTGAVLYGNPVNRTAHQIATAILESADEVDESILNFAVKVCDTVTEENNKLNVTFNVNGNTEAVAAQRVKSGETAAEVAAPVVAGNAFLYWSLTEGGEAYDFATPVTEDITLYAVLKAIPTTFTFEDADINALWATRGYDDTAVVSFADGAMTITQAADYTTIGNLGWTITDYKYLVVKAKSETNVNSVEFLVRGDADRRYFISELTSDYQTYYIDISERDGYAGSLTDVYVGSFSGTVTIDEIAFVNELPEAVQYLNFADWSADGDMNTTWNAVDGWRAWGTGAAGYLSYNKADTIDTANKYFVIDFSSHDSLPAVGFNIFLRTTDANGDNPAQADYFVPGHSVVSNYDGQRHVIDMSDAFDFWTEGKVVTHLRVYTATAAGTFDAKIMDMRSMYLTSVAPFPTNTVTVVVNGVSTEKTIKTGDTLEALSAPAAAAGEYFSYWSLTEGGEAYDFATPVTEDITLYAVFNTIPTTFTFEDAGLNALWATRGIDPTAVVSFADGAMTVTQAADYTTIGNLGWTITDYKYLVVKAKSETNVNSVEFLVRGDADRRYYISGLTADYQTYYIDISECYGYTGSLTDVYVGQFNGTVTIDEIAFVNELPETVQYLAFSDFSADGSFSTPWSAADSWRLWPNAYGYLSYTKTIDVANKYFVIDFSAHAAVTPTGFDIFLRTTDANGDNPAQANYFVPVEVVGGQRHVIDMSEAFSGIWAEGKVVTHLRVMPATAANACESKVMDMYSMYLTSVAPYPTNTVTVIVNGDSTEKTIKSGAALSALSTPAAADGKYFSHWSLTEDGEAYDINTPVTEDITLYAVFEDALTTLGAMWTNANNGYDTAISYSADGLRAVSASGTGRLVITGLSANAADYAVLSVKVKENVDALSWIQFIVETENGNNFFNLENLSTDYNEYVFDLSTLNGDTIVCMQILSYEGVAFDLSFSQIEFLTFEDLDVPTTLGYSWSPIDWCPAELSYAPGSFTMASADGTGRMYIPGMSDKVDDYKYLAVRVKNNGVGERVRLLFENDVENMNYHVVGITSEYQDYYFDISALHGKTITTIQLLASTAYSFTFEKIEFTNELPENVQYLDFADWAAEGDMNTTWSAESNWRAWVTGTGYLSYNKVADIDTANNYFVIDFSSHDGLPAAGFNIFVRTTDADGENAAQADYFVPVSEYVTVDRAYECQRYVVNLSEAFAGIWAEGKVVTHLRVYTATAAGVYDAKIMDMKEMYLTSLSE